MEKLMKDEDRSQGDLTHAATDLQQAADKLKKWDKEIFHKGAASAAERKWANEHSQIESEIQQAAEYIKESQEQAEPLGLAQEPVSESSMGRGALRFQHTYGASNIYNNEGAKYNGRQTPSITQQTMSSPILAVVVAAILVVIYTRKNDRISYSVRPTQEDGSSATGSYQTVSTEIDELRDDEGSWHRKVADSGEQLASDSGFS
jgi:hypothetical protein